jgi:hypothetical protein
VTIQLPRGERRFEVKELLTLPSSSGWSEAGRRAIVAAAVR